MFPSVSNFVLSFQLYLFPIFPISFYVIFTAMCMIKIFNGGEGAVDGEGVAVKGA